MLRSKLIQHSKEAFVMIVKISIKQNCQTPDESLPSPCTRRQREKLGEIRGWNSMP